MVFIYYLCLVKLLNLVTMKNLFALFVVGVLSVSFANAQEKPATEQQEKPATEKKACCKKNGKKSCSKEDKASTGAESCSKKDGKKSCCKDKKKKA